MPHDRKCPNPNCIISNITPANARECRSALISYVIYCNSVLTLTIILLTMMDPFDPSRHSPYIHCSWMIPMAIVTVMVDRQPENRQLLTSRNAATAFLSMATSTWRIYESGGDFGSSWTDVIMLIAVAPLHLGYIYFNGKEAQHIIRCLLDSNNKVE